MSKLSEILNENFPQSTTELRPSLERHVNVSCEGLLSTLKGFFSSDGSKKGKDGKFDESKEFIHDIDRFLKNTYTNERWLNRQRFKTGDVSGSSVVSVIGERNATPENLLSLVKTANKEVGVYRNQWQDATSRYLSAILPARKILLEGPYTPANLKIVKDILSKEEKVLVDKTKFPMVFSATGHRVVKLGNGFKVPLGKDGGSNIQALSLTQVRDVSAQVSVGIEEFLNKEIEQFFIISDVYDELDPTSDMIRHRLGDLESGKEQWESVFSKLNSSDLLYSNEHVLALFDHYNQVILAVTRYIDRSIV